MPFDAAAHNKVAGAELTAAAELALRTEVQSVIGTAGASQGLVAANVVGPIPNEFFDYTGNIVALQIDAYIASGSALGCPPTTLPMPFGGRLWYVAAQSTVGTPHTVIIAKAGKVVWKSSFAPASADRFYLSAVATSVTFEIGDLITVANIASGFDAPDVGDELAEEAFDCQASYELWFIPDEED